MGSEGSNGNIFISYENIYIKPYGIKELHELTIYNSINDHSRIHITGLLDGDTKDGCVFGTDSKTGIEVSTKGNEGQEIILFKGIITDINVNSVRDLYYVEIKGASYTYEMDFEKKQRSFQNKEMLFADLVKSVISSYPGADFIDRALKTAKTRKYIMQYDETDWEFMKRMASRFNTGLVPDTASAAPKFWFGIPEGNEGGTLEKQNYSVVKNLGEFRNSLNNYVKGAKEVDYIFYRVESKKYLNIGDTVVFKGKKLYISGKEMSMKKGILKYEYTVTSQEGMRVNPGSNEQIAGTAIEGRVLDRKEDNVKVHLSIDKEQKREEAWWFPYSTFYTAEGNTGWYCMPEIGDSVKVYFPEDEENEGFVMESVRRGAKAGDKVEDPDIKYFRTKFNKEMMFAPKELVLTGRDNGVILKLNEDKGIDILSDRKIDIKAQNDIILHGGKIEITAGDEIDIKCRTSSIKMNGLTHIKGSPVKEDQGFMGSVENLFEQFTEMIGIKKVSQPHNEQTNSPQPAPKPEPKPQPEQKPDSKGTPYTYKNKKGETVTKNWNITNDDFKNSKALTQEQVTEICKKNNPGLVEKGFDKAIYEYSQNKGVNPKVVLATLAQEQGWCKNGKYDKAFGVGPGGDPQSFAEGEKGGLAKAVNAYVKLFKEGEDLEKKGKLGSLLVNKDSGLYKETKAVFGSGTEEWQKNNPEYVEFMEKGQKVEPVNAAMYAKLRYTPWVDFPPQNSHPLETWHNIYQSF